MVATVYMEWDTQDLHNGQQDLRRNGHRQLEAATAQIRGDMDNPVIVVTGDFNAKIGAEQAEGAQLPPPFWINRY